ncbi:MAG: hypothetical protein M1832_003415 [Thelocarpon impressellum]|nr:MAG: hypothetical protein M1832_003415 [Thelocarpon impressellum]
MSGWSFGDQSNGSMSSASPSLSAADHSEKTAVPVTQDLRSGSQDSTSAGSSTSLGGPLRLNFLIRPYKGMTAHLRGFILQGGTGRREINAFIEGPYGESAPVFEADSVLFIAGGSGISAVLPFLHQLRHPQPALPRFGKTRRSTTTMTKDMHVVWAVREQAFASGVVASELHVPSKRGNPTITLSIHVTGRTSSSPPLPASPSVGDDKPGRPSLSPTTTTLSEPGQDSQRPHPPTFTFHRPDINAIVHGAARDASARGSLAVFVCGPAQMADQARRAAVEVVRMRAGAGGAGAVKYYEEKFGW